MMHHVMEAALSSTHIVSADNLVPSVLRAILTLQFAQTS